MKFKYYTSTLFVLLALTFGCYTALVSKSFEQEESKNEVPDEWFLYQRTYPNKTINTKVYAQAVERVKAERSIEKRSSQDWELVGPANVGGRVTSLALHPNSQNTIFVGTATGGIFKSTDKGASWKAVFDEDGSRVSIGALALAPSNPRILYAGTGEANASGGSGAFFGDGMYRSDDGGRSWRNIGLKNAFHIGRIVINPQNEDHVLVAAAGRLYDTNEERGLYRTLDGGETWEQILFLNEEISCIDVAINPWNPDIIYAAMWERLRAPWQRDYGGNGSAIYRTRDGGVTWQRLEAGLPQASRSERGRIGLAISQSDPNTLYASFTKDVITNEFDGVYKTTDGGDTWTETTRYQLIGAYSSFGWYFGNVRIDPTNPDVAYVLGINMFKTVNGGETWRTITGGMHVDQHALAIHPQNSDYMVAGNDGGVYISENGGLTWTHCDNLPITQFYECGISQEGIPDYYGGTQDNGTIKMGDSDTGNWTQILGGDGFHTLIDPNNAEIVYAEYQWGNLFRSLNGGRSFQQKMNGIDGSDRNNWNTPVVFDPSNSSVLYYGTQRLYRSDSKAASWTAISGDLTKGEHESGSQKYGTITAIAAAKSDSDVIYVGTDDGNVQVTFDMGENWQLVSDSLPNRYVTALAVDPTDAFTVYVTLSGYRRVDYQPHILVTRDGGDHWFDISGNLPEIPINDVLLDPENQGHIYISNDLGVWFTENRGEEWQILGKGLPMTVISDLALHHASRSLIAATYGRSMYKYPLEVEKEVEVEIPTVDPVVVMFSSYPNPVTTEAMLEIEVEKNLSGNLIGYDLAGKQVYEQTFSFVEGINQMRVNMSNLQSGSYWFVVESEGEIVAKQAIVKY